MLGHARMHTYTPAHTHTHTQMSAGTGYTGTEPLGVRTLRVQLGTDVATLRRERKVTPNAGRCERPRRVPLVVAEVVVVVVVLVLGHAAAGGGTGLDGPVLVVVVVEILVVAFRVAGRGARRALLPLSR